MILDIERQLAEKRKEIRESVENREGIKPVTMESLFGFSEAEFDDFIANLTGKVKDFQLELGEPPKAPEMNLPNKYIQSLEDLNDTLPDSEDLVVSFASNTMNAMTNGFTRAITGAENFADAMRNMAKSVIDSLIQMAVQYLITQQIFSAMRSPCSTLRRHLKVWTETLRRTKNRGSASARFRGGGFTGLGARAGGVDGKGGFPAILHPNETVIDHKRTGSGIAVVQHINVTTGVQQTVRAEIANLFAQISNAAKAAVADAGMRGGGFMRAMAGV